MPHSPIDRVRRTTILRGSVSGKRRLPARMRTSAPQPGFELQGDSYGLCFSVVAQGLFAHLAPPAGLFVSAERQRGVEDVVAVHPDGARADALSQFVGDAHVARPDAGGEAVFGVIGLGGDTVEVAVGKRLRANHRAEDLFLDDLHLGSSFRQHGWLNEVAMVAGCVATAEYLRSLSNAGLDVSGDAVELFVADQRSHFRRWIHARADLDLACDLAHSVDDLVVDLFVDHQAGA